MLAIGGVVASVLLLSDQQSLALPLIALTMPVVAAILAIYLLVRALLKR
jgi:hypothetical protein